MLALILENIIRHISNVHSEEPPSAGVTSGQWFHSVSVQLKETCIKPPLEKTFRACPQATCSVPKQLKQKQSQLWLCESRKPSLECSESTCPLSPAVIADLHAAQTLQLKSSKRLDMPGQPLRQMCSGLDPENRTLYLEKVKKNPDDYKQKLIRLRRSV